MIQARTLTCGRPLDIGECYRQLLAAAIVQAVEDLLLESYYHRSRALWWLQAPETRELALLIDVDLPDPTTLPQYDDSYRRRIHGGRDAMLPAQPVRCGPTPAPAASAHTLEAQP